MLITRSSHWWLMIVYKPEGIITKRMYVSAPDPLDVSTQYHFFQKNFYPGSGLVRLETRSRSQAIDKLFGAGGCEQGIFRLEDCWFSR
jgi:hypothetical protein